MASVDVTRIASNIGALNALNSLNNINAKLAMHQTRLSTGKRINSAADDPAGLTIATKMLSRSEGMKVALDNIGDASNMLAVTESGLSKMNDILVIMRNKAEQAASDTLGTSERDAIATQLSAFANQIDSMVSETKWNSALLLDGSVNKRFQTGVDAGEYTTFQMTSKFDPGTLGISTDVAADATNNIISQGTTNLGATVNASYLHTGLTKLSTGTYTVSVTGKAATAAVGAASVITNSSFSAALGAVAPTAGSELTNGTHTIQITGAVTTAGLESFTYSIDGATAVTQTLVGDSGLVSVGNAAGTGAFRGITLGSAGDGTDVLAAARMWNIYNGGTTNTISFDYIQKDTVKYTMKTGSGELVAIDSDGANGTSNPTSTTGYAAAGAATSTGRGVAVSFDPTIANVVNGGTNYFDFKALNHYSVDVSSATKASTYMNTVNTAMDTVNSSLASLGSLMARLSYKAEQVANAQVNIEGSYSRIMNANMAEEQMNASKYSILQQVAVSMLAQANQAPQSLLALFR